jgi:CheY-like chemotaxis protein/tRNA A-37 threonylcarbamoyl transferase component Bud32
MAKILVVDDDADLAGIVQDWLMTEDHSVEVAIGGIKAWERLQADQYDIVIMDWDMPDINGIDVLKRFRAAGGLTPVIMLTGRTAIDDKEKGLDTGADDYVTKPFHMKELTARIRVCLRKSATQAQPEVPKALGTNNEPVLKRGDLIGTTLASRYEFLDVIGEGGVGIVFRARHPHLDKIVAVKMLQANAQKENTILRFEREAKAISRLEHPNIAMVYDFGITERKRPFMVMEFIDGRSLDDFIQREGAMSIKRAIDLLIQICDGMAHAHDSGIVHRDIKPSNIMLKQIPMRAPVPKILDFGCAKMVEPDAMTQQERQLTQVGHSFGSPPYMSPEQVRGKSLDERSDIYSFGCLIYELLTGALPYDDPNVVEIMFMHLEQNFEPLGKKRPDLVFPPEIEAVVAKALAKEPEQRYQNMREMQADLELIKAKMQIAASGSP